MEPGGIGDRSDSLTEGNKSNTVQEHNAMNADELINNISAKVSAKIPSRILMRFFEELIGLNDRESGRTVGDGKAFELLCAKYVLDLSTDLDDSVNISGSGDGGIDVFHINETSKKIEIMQCKFNQALDNKLDDADLSYFAGILDRLNGTFGGNKEFKLTQDTYKNKINEGYSVDLYFINAGEFTDRQSQHIEMIKNSFSEYEQENKEIEVNFNALGIYELLAYFSDIPTPECKLEINNEETFYTKNKIPHRLVTSIRVFELVNVCDSIGSVVFSINPRSYLKQKKMSNQIKETARNNSDMFWHYNNGISAICSDFYVNGTTLTITNFKIVNGRQTISALKEIKKHLGNSEILLRLTMIDNTDSRRTLISQYTNTQNLITNSDLLAHTEKIRQLKDDFERHWPKFLFEHQRGLYNTVSDPEQYNPRELYVIDRTDACKLRMSYGLKSPREAFTLSPKNISGDDDDFKKLFGKVKPEDFILPQLFYYILQQINKDSTKSNSREAALLKAKLSQYYILAIIGASIDRMVEEGVIDPVNVIKCAYNQSKFEKLKNITKNHITDKFYNWLDVVFENNSSSKKFDKYFEDGINNASATRIKSVINDFEKNNNGELFTRIISIRKAIIENSNDDFRIELVELVKSIE